MPATWDEKPAKDFMNIRNKNSSTVVCLQKWFCRPALVGLFFIAVTCSPDRGDDPIPFVPFSPIVLNLNLPEYIALKSNGGFKELSSSVGGVQGIIVYRVDASTYRAYERNCSYQPNDACVTVSAHSSGLYMVDPCCGSTFSFSDGSPLGTPAWRPLRQYQTSVLNSELSITDEIVE